MVFCLWIGPYFCRLISKWFGYIKVLSKSLYCVSLCFNVGHANLLQFINRVFDTTPQFHREKFLENEDEMHFTERSQLPMCYSTICLCREKGKKIPGQWFSGMWPSQNTERSAELKVSNYGVKNFEFDTNWRQNRHAATNRHQNNRSIRAPLTGAPWKKPKMTNMTKKTISKHIILHFWC